MTKKEKQHKLPKIVHICFNILFYALTIYVVAFLLLQTFFPNQAISIFGFKTSLVSNTRSMEPYLHQDDFIVIKKTDFNDVHKGDKISFLSKQSVNGKEMEISVVHTVIDIVTDPNTGKKSYRTKGINDATNPVPDLRLVTSDGQNYSNQFLGKYAFTVPFLGHFIAFLKSPYGWITSIIDISVIVAILFVLKQGSKKETQELKNEYV